jgi:hypothetical protein
MGLADSFVSCLWKLSFSYCISLGKFRFAYSGVKIFSENAEALAEISFYPTQMMGVKRWNPLFGHENI